MEVLSLLHTPACMVLLQGTAYLCRVDVCCHIAQVAPSALWQGVAHVTSSCLQIGTCAVT